MKKFSVMLEELVLNEVKVRGSKPREGSHVLSAGKNIYVWNNERELERIVPFINKELGTDFDDEYDIDQWYNEGSKIVYGTIERGGLRLPGESAYKPSSGDKQTGKVLKALGLHSTSRSLNTFDDDYEEYEHEFETRRDEFNKTLSKKTFYHGTCTTYIESMLKVGLKPDTGSTQFDNIIHRDKVFITTAQDKAMFHATTAARNNNSFPVIITLSIPDESKLVSDYDVVIDTIGADSEEAQRLGYDDIWYSLPGSSRGDGRKGDSAELMQRYGKQLDRLSTDVGIFGYKGRIPASFFKKLIADTDVIEESMVDNYYDMGPDFDLSAMHSGEMPNHRQFDYWYESRPDRFVSDLQDRWDDMLEEHEDDY